MWRNKEGSTRTIGRHKHLGLLIGKVVDRICWKLKGNASRLHIIINAILLDSTLKGLSPVEANAIFSAGFRHLKLSFFDCNDK